MTTLASPAKAKTVDELLKEFKISSIVVDVPLDQIIESPLNKRSDWGDTSYVEFQGGVKVAALGRPHPSGKVEMVFGARRLRASNFWKFPTLPMTIRELTDAQVRELQVIENFQRHNGHYLDEAEWYRDMHDLDKLTNEQIGKKIGRLPNYVATRVRLAKLVPEVKQLCVTTLPLSVALLLTRVRPLKQLEAARKLVEEGYAVELHEARSLIAGQYMLQLAKAQFDVKDATLYPERGACGTCPDNSGEVDSTGEFAAKNVCTYQPCYAEKTRRVVQLKIDKAKAQGRTVIEGKAAEALFKKERWQTTFTPRDSHVDAAAPFHRPGETSKPYAKVLGNKAIIEHSVVAVAPDGIVHTLLERKELPTLLKEAGIKTGHGYNGRPTLTDAEAKDKKAPDAAARNQEVEELAVERVLAAIRERVPNAMATLRVILPSFVYFLYPDTEKHYGVTRPLRGDSKLSDGKLTQLILECYLEQVKENLGAPDFNDDLAALCDLFKIDVDQLDDEVKAKHEPPRPPPKQTTFGGLPDAGQKPTAHKPSKPTKAKPAPKKAAKGKRK